MRASIVALAAAELVAGCAATPTHSRGATPGSSARPIASATAAVSGALARAVRLNDGERLDPPPVNARPKLSATQAWTEYTTRNHARINRTHLPAGVTAHLALFTTSGDIKHRLVYGYRIPGCHPIYVREQATPYPTGCVGWEILDADTSIDLDSAWEGLPEQP